MEVCTKVLRLAKTSSHTYNMCWGVGLPSSEKLVNPGGEFDSQIHSQIHSQIQSQIHKYTPKCTPKYTDFLLFSGRDPLKPPIPPKYTPNCTPKYTNFLLFSGGEPLKPPLPPKCTPNYTPKYTDFLLFSGGGPLKPPVPPGAPAGGALFFLFFNIQSTIGGQNLHMRHLLKAH